MYDKLEIQLPWKILQDLKFETLSRFSCQSTNSEQFELEISRSADNCLLNFSGNLPKDGQIHIKKLMKIKEPITNESDNSTFNRPVINFQFHSRARQSYTNQNITIEQLVTNSVDDTSRQKQKKKTDHDFISSELIPEANDELVNSLSFLNSLSSYATVSGSESSQEYTCKECGEVYTSQRRLYCHLEKHGGFHPWTCAECDYAAPFQSLLVRHAASRHGSIAETVKTAETVETAKTATTNKSQNPKTASKKAAVSKRKTDSVLKRTSKRKPKPKFFPEFEEKHISSVDAEFDSLTTKTVAIEIEVRPDPEKPEPMKLINSNTSKSCSPNKSGTIEVAMETDSPVTDTDGFAVLELVNIKIRGDPNIDRRLRQVGKNYQFVIDEYCQLVEDKFQCKLCYQTYKKRNQFMDHLYKRHEECRPYYCLLCDFRTRGKPNVFTHNSYRHSQRERPYTCECGTSFLTKSKYEAHSVIHSEQHDFRCDECESVFATKHGLLEHVRRVHREKSFPCDICNKKFSTAYSRKVHSNVHEPGRRWKCLYCQKMYRSEQSLKIHMHSHTTVFHCQICDKDIYSYSAFIGHRNLHDPKTRKHPCSVCGRLFPSRKARDKHVIVHHSEMNFEHKCQVCDKSFKLLEQLNSHMICHSKSKPWICEVCGQAFKRQSTLCTHRNKHGQQNRAPFICTFCRLEFPTYSELADHLVREEKAGLCQYCHRLFSSRPLLEQHVVSAHHQGEQEPGSVYPGLRARSHLRAPGPGVGSVLQEYLTSPTETLEEEMNEERPLDNRVTIVGPSLITYGSDGQQLVEGLHKTPIQVAPTKVAPIQVAPTRVKTKVIHSGRNSSVVAQIRTTPVIEGSTGLIPMVNNSSRPARQPDKRHTATASVRTVKLSNTDGDVMDVPVVEADHQQTTVVDFVEQTA